MSDILDQEYTECSNLEREYVDMEVDKVADMVADMQVNEVADMEVDEMAGIDGGGQGGQHGGRHGYGQGGRHGGRRGGGQGGRHVGGHGGRHGVVLSRTFWRPNFFELKYTTACASKALRVYSPTRRLKMTSPGDDQSRIFQKN